MPEIIGKWYSRKPIAGDDGIVVYPVDSRSSDESDEEDYEKLWCFCGQPSYGRMILCDNDCCPIQWFHCDCFTVIVITVIVLHQRTCYLVPVQQVVHEHDTSTRT